MVKNESPKPNGHEGQHQPHAGGDAEETRQAATDADLDSHRREQDVAWTGCAGGNHGEQEKGNDLVGTHRGDPSSTELHHATTPVHRLGVVDIGLERSCEKAVTDWMRQTAVVDGVERLEARLQRFGYHQHRHDTYAISLTDAGLLAFAYRGATHLSMPGQVVVLHPDERHDGYASTDAGIRYREVYVDPARIAEAVRAICGHARTLPFVPQPVVSSVTLAAAIHRAFQEDPDPLATDDLVVRIAEGLLAADPGSPSSSPRRVLDLAAVERARAFLEAERTRVIHSSELERITGLNRYELSRQFRAVLGTSPYRYSLMRRLANARLQLVQRRPLVDVALETGFADQAHFTRMFSATYGVTPGRYAVLAGAR